MRRPQLTRSSPLSLALLAVAAAALVGILVKQDYREAFFSGGGLATGALVAAIALGVVITYRGSGVVNLANGAVAMYTAYVYADLRKSGDLFLPPLPNPLAPIEGIVHRAQGRSSTFTVPHWPTTISLGGRMPFWPALLISLVFCVLFGLLLHFLIFRPLRNAPVLAKVVASVGLLLFLQAVVIRRFSTNAIAVRPLPVLKRKLVDLGLFTITQDQLFVVVLVIVLTAALWFLFQRTRFGLAVRAAAENEKGATVLGFSPESLAAATWVISTVVTGVLGVVVASVNSTVDPTVMPALIVPAVTAALVGSFTSFGWTTFAAFLLGMQVSFVAFLGVNASWFPQMNGGPLPGVDKLVPLIVIIVVLARRGGSLPVRGAIAAARLPFSPTPPSWAIRWGGPALAVAAGIGALLFSPAYRGALANTLTGIIICLSIVVVTGFVGQISLAQMAFAGLSAYLVADLSDKHGWPFPLPIIAGALVAVVAGVLLAVPALRVRGVNLAIATLAFAVAVDQVIFGNTAVNGGFDGASVRTPKLIDPNNDAVHHFLGIKIGDGSQPNVLTGLFCLVIVVLLCYLVANIRRSSTGRKMLATRSNERAAAAAGVNVAATKVLAFALSAFIAGVGGAVIAYRAGNVTPDKFLYDKSLIFFAFAYLGGIASVTGAIAGGTLVSGGLAFTFLEQTLGLPDEFVLLLGGVGLIVTAVANPEGISGRLRSLGLALRPRWPSGSDPDPSPTVSTPRPATPAPLDASAAGAKS